MNSAREMKVIVIGIDGGNLDVVGEGVKEGKLKTFEKFMKEGVYGSLESVVMPISPSAWASFLTGKNPGKHGIFDFYVRDKKFARRRRPVNARDIGAKTVYEILSENNKKVGMLNVPLTYPVKEINGFIVSSLLTPPGREYTWPPSLQQELDSLGYQIELDEAYQCGKEKEFFQSVKEMIRKRKKALRYLMDQYDWDLLIGVFRETDVLSHAFWKFMDKNHPHFDEELSRKYRDCIMEIYGAIDNFLSEIIHQMDDATVLMVVSDHGFASQHRMVCLNTWLAKNGFLRFKRDLATTLRKILFYYGMTPEKIWELITRSKTMYNRLVKNVHTRNKLARRVFLSYDSLDWQRTLAYAFGSVEAWGAIYLNTDKIDLSKPEEYDELRERLMEKLLRLREPQTNRPIVKTVYRKEEVYQGSYLKEAPDILVEWKQGYVSDPYFFGGDKIISNIPPARSGAHHFLGLFLVYGKEIAKGMRLQNARILDMAPTILNLFELPVPEDMDGRVLKEIFKKDSELAKKEVLYRKAEAKKKEKKPEVFTKEEEERIKERLRGLGYLD
ncbi:MAG: alkaline phosphatase family protein [bacterium]